jgi:ABC-type transporter Mla MlaB component
MQDRANWAHSRWNGREDFAAETIAAPPRDRDMLRITVTETAVEERWILQGQLTKRSVAELVSNWKTSMDHPPRRCRVVDLNEVTAIDKSGEEALSMMVRDGATFVASGVYTKHLLDQLRAQRTNQQLD